MAMYNQPQTEFERPRRRQLLQDLSPESSASASAPNGPIPPSPTSGIEPVSAPHPLDASATPASGYDYQKAQSSWFNAAPNTTIDQWTAANPSFTQGIKSSKGGEMMTLPNGVTFDAVRDFGPGGANAPIWGSQQMDYNTGRVLTPAESAAAEAQWAQAHPGGSGIPGGAAGTGGAGGADGAGSLNATSSSTSTADPQLQAALRDQLLKILGQGQPSITDPTLAPQSAAYRGARERAGGQERAALAERAAFTGLNSGGQGSGAFDTGIQGIQENVGQDVAANDAGLVGQEVQARRQQLMQALDLANAVGARTEANALQMQLAQLDNQFRYSSLNENARQANNSLGYNYDQLQAVLNRQAMLDTLGQGA